MYNAAVSNGRSGRFLGVLALGAAAIGCGGGAGSGETGGTAGWPGTSGQAGTAGAAGAPGSSMATGGNGAAGSAGAAGSSATAGVSGTVGAAGTTGDAGAAADADAASDGALPADAAPSPTACSVDLVASTYHLCARKADGTLWCWGKNDSGQIGDGTKSASAPKPTQVAALGADVAEVAVGYYHTCARKKDGSAWCWGANDYGQLGDGTTTSSPTPVRVTALGNAAAHIATGTQHSCAIKNDGTLWCWGQRLDGKTSADGTYMATAPVPIDPPADMGVVEVSGAYLHTCARKTGGDVYCWGGNSAGQLGDGTGTTRNMPTPVKGLSSGAAQVATGYYRSCALKADGDLWCWGEDLGDGKHSRDPDPTRVNTSRHGFSQVALGGEVACAARPDGSLACWGRNQYGQLGTGTTDSLLAPAEISAISGVVQVAVGIDTTCVRRMDSSIWCWGGNRFGEIGNGTTTGSLEPVPALLCAPSGGGADAGVPPSDPPVPRVAGARRGQLIFNVDTVKARFDSEPGYPEYDWSCHLSTAGGCEQEHCGTPSPGQPPVFLDVGTIQVANLSNGKSVAVGLAPMTPLAADQLYDHFDPKALDAKAGDQIRVATAGSTAVPAFTVTLTVPMDTTLVSPSGSHAFTLAAGLPFTWGGKPDLVRLGARTNGYGFASSISYGESTWCVFPGGTGHAIIPPEAFVPTACRGFGISFETGVAEAQMVVGAYTVTVQWLQPKGEGQAFFSSCTP